MNANEIANGILSALVGITAGCAFVDYWAACLIGGLPGLFFIVGCYPFPLPLPLPLSPALSVVLYHLGCYAEYKFNLKDTAHVVPVHGVCGLWSVVAIGLLGAGTPARCNLHAAFEGLCYCHLRLPVLVCTDSSVCDWQRFTWFFCPPQGYGELLGAQIAGGLIMIGISVVACSLFYGTLYLLPVQPVVWVAEK